MAERVVTKCGREGPAIRTEASCSGCAHEKSESYAVQGDSGFDVSCLHPKAPTSNRIGDSIWRTPEWCPLMPRAASSAEVTRLYGELADSEAKRTRLAENVLALLAKTGPRFPLYCAYCNGCASPVDHQSDHHRQWLEWKAQQSVVAPTVASAELVAAALDLANRLSQDDRCDEEQEALCRAAEAYLAKAAALGEKL